MPIRIMSKFQECSISHTRSCLLLKKTALRTHQQRVGPAMTITMPRMLRQIYGGRYITADISQKIHHRRYVAYHKNSHISTSLRYYMIYIYTCIYVHMIYIYTHIYNNSSNANMQNKQASGIFRKSHPYSLASEKTASRTSAESWSCHDNYSIQYMPEYYSI